MGRGDKLASGAKSAQFPSAGGGFEVKDNRRLNIMTDAEREKLHAEDVAAGATGKVADIAKTTPEVKAAPKECPIEPLYDRVVVRRLSDEERSAGGNLYIPDTAKEAPQEGVVLAVGGGRVLQNGQTYPVVVDVGEHVYFGKYGGLEIIIDGEEYLVLREEELVGVKRTVQSKQHSYTGPLASGNS